MHDRKSTTLIRGLRYDLVHDDFTAVSLSHATSIAIAQCSVVYETGIHYRL
jgi:hypothetical protein